MRTEAAYVFSPQPSAAGEARAHACTWAAGADEEALGALELVVSELVTNALQHGTGDITLTLRELDTGLQVEVHDHGPGTPAARRASIRRPGGRGLTIVRALTTAWGIRDASEDGKTVWALIAASTPAPGLVDPTHRDGRS